MPTRDRLTVLGAILEDGFVPHYTAADPDVAWTVPAACQKVGIRAVEFMNRVDMGHEIVAELVKRAAKEAPDIIIGSGTIQDAATAALHISAGASFIVSPTFDAEVARLCNRRRIVYIPGCGSATEVLAAEEWGCEIIKLFPAAAFDGPAFIRGILGPNPATKLMPTNIDASEDIVRKWFMAGACAVGVGSSLMTPGIIKFKETDMVAERLGSFREWVMTAKRAIARANGDAASRGGARTPVVDPRGASR